MSADNERLWENFRALSPDEKQQWLARCGAPSTLADPRDAINFYVGQQISFVARPRWWRRVGSWLSRVVLRRQPIVPTAMVVASVDRERGVITYEVR